MEEKYYKNFDEWNKKKQVLDARTLPDDFFFLEREIWWASLGVNIGKEIDGKHGNFERPVLILKICGFEGLWVLPISTKEKVGQEFHQTVYHDESQVISLLQMRYISSNRLLRLIRRMDESEFISIKDKMQNLLYKNETPYF